MGKIFKHIGLWGLTLSGIGTMIGSGWLFGAWKAARLAGPAAIFAWPIGALAMLLLAFAYAELGARYPAVGGMVRYTQLSHGSFAGFIAGWANWIAIVSVIPIEAASSVQYMSSWSWDFTSQLYNPYLHQLTPYGLMLSGVFIVFYFLLNYWSVKLFLHSMMALTLFKILIPSLTCVALFVASFHQGTFNLVHENFMPYGMSGVFTAVATAGIIFSFHGFQSPINLSGEAINPKRDVPLAIIISIGISFVLYLLLQIAFIGTVSPKDIAFGWHRLNFSSPFVHLALALNLNWLVILIYLDAFVSPSGTGITYTATTSRMLYGLQSNGYMPEFIGRVHPLYHISRPAMWINLIISFVFLYLFKGWSTLVAVISVSSIISYVNGPVSAMTLRYRKHRQVSPVKIRGLRYIAPIAFIVISFVLYWARWPLTGKVILIMLAGLPIYFYYQNKNGWKTFKEDWRPGIWLPCYLLTMALISFLGSKAFGGWGKLNYAESLIAVGVVAAIYYYWGLKSGRSRFINTKKPKLKSVKLPAKKELPPRHLT